MANPASFPVPAGVKYFVPVPPCQAKVRGAICLAFGAVPLLWSACLSAGIWLSAISGTSVDESGKPLPGAILRFTNPANGKSFEITSNPEGRFTYIAVEPAHYRLDVIRARHQPVTFADIYLEWSSRPLLLDIDLRSHSVRVTREVMLAETLGTEPPASALPNSGSQDTAIARDINEKIASAAAFMAAGAWDSALTAAKAATEIGPNRDLPWAWLGNVYCSEAQHTTPPPVSSLNNCIQQYKRAIAIAPSSTYFNNVGVAYAGMNHWEDAAENFRAALLANPDHAALYHLNLGSALLKRSESTSDTPIALLESARREFSAAASDTPAINDAYYWKGLCELRLAAAGGQAVTFDMARDSFARYLHLDASGRYATEARTMLEGLDAARLQPSRVKSDP